ncbi:MAG: single-stranded DNA-binding protein [Nitrospirales bacterium]|nr:single-stranded DNA-binding protein [Nitrospirales bacterium]
MMGFNLVVMIGNLTRAPELRYTPGGTAVASFGLAVNRTYMQDQEKKEDVCFIDVVCFGRTAENVSQYLDKGQPVHVQGRLQQRQWETQGGEKKSKHEVVAERVIFLNTKGGGGSGNAGNREADYYPDPTSYQ